MTYFLGDPAHINLGHNDLVALIEEQADRFMVTVTLPDTATLGEAGHVADHNLIVAALQTIADAPTGALPPVVSGTTGSPTITTPTVDGQTGTLYDFGANGTFTCSTAGRARLLCIGAGSADSGPNYGNAGAVVAGWVDFPSGSTTITVGAIGTAGSPGGNSKVGAIAGANGGPRPTYASGSIGSGRWLGVADYAGTPDDITGSSVTYAAGQGSGLTTYGSNISGSAVAGRVFIFVPD